MLIQVKCNLKQDIERIKEEGTGASQELIASIENWINNDLNNVNDLFSWESYKMRNKEKIQEITANIAKIKEITGKDIICDNMLWLIKSGPQFYNED